MTKTVKIILISALSGCLAALVLYCVRFGKTPEEKLAENGAVSAEDVLKAAAELSAVSETAMQNGTAKHITLSDDGSIATSSGVRIQGNNVTVTSSGVYRVSGTLTEGQLAVDCDGMAVIILDGVEIANSADAAICVLGADHTLIYLPEGSNNRLVSGTEREITTASGNADVESASGAALYARDSLSIAGSGKMTVCGYVNNAVATTDHLTILGGELALTAVNNGLKGKDSVTILDGVINIHSGNDGIKSNNDVQADCGHVDIRGGEVSIVSLGDGMHAETYLAVEDGIITISAGDMTSSYSGTPMPNGTAQGGFPGNDGEMDFPGNDGGMGFPGNDEGPGFPDMQSDKNSQGGEAAPELPNGTAQGGFPGAQGGMHPQGGEAAPEMPQGTQPQGRGGRTDGGSGNSNDPSGNMRGQGGMRGDFADMYDREWSYGADSEASTKGLKSGGDLMVSGGSITVNSVDDCIHANGSITVTGGTFLLATDDDGFHADDTLTVSDGNITVSESYEGLEGHLIYLKGGNISVTASDDGINAGGSAMFGRMHGASGSDDSSLSVLRISGGTLYVDADGDGLDSNGDLIVEGGNIIVDGPADSGNGALDSGSENGGSLVCHGGTILAIGASGMAESFESDSTQCSFIKNFSGTLSAGTQIIVTDENGKVILEHESAKSFNSVVFSSPELVLGSTYAITAGDQTEKITMEGISNGGSSGFGIGGHNRK